ncbi:hypothetical protein [Microbacterium sp. NPDC091662]|uniref:phage major capsid protein n=1 Tax=Microbacterium sp. NPDC091662 TaxID=3364211 RepID=UPI003814778C
MTENQDLSQPLIENDSPSQVGQFAFDPESRKLRGNLLELGVKSRPSQTGHVGYFTADTLNLPRDPSVVTLNRRHDPQDPVGRATVLEVRENYVYAEFQLGDTDEADAWLTEEKDALRKLSAEVRYLDSDLKSARLTGAALVTEGAFANAGLFALAPEEEAAVDAVVEALNALDPEALAEVLERVTPVSEDPQSEDTSSQEGPDEESTDEEKSKVTDLFQPEGLTPEAKTNTGLSALFAQAANPTAEGAEAFRRAGHFAIQNIQESGPSGRTIYDDTASPVALGELWEKQAYSQRFMPLISQAPLTDTTARGWRWVSKPQVGDYAGNLAEVPSNVIDTEEVTVKAQRLAGGHKLDRIYRDFNNLPVIESYFRNQTEDVARKLDAKALAAIMAAATTTAPGVVPAGVDKGMAAIVDGALAVIETENRPSFALVSPELYRDILLTNDDDKLAFLNAGFGLEEGDFASFKIVPANIGTGKVIVGAKEAVKFFTPSPSPILVEGLDVHHGGVDLAVFTYYASIAENAAAIRSVTVAGA